MPLDDAPQIGLRDKIFQGLFTLVGREPQTFSLLHRLLLVAAQMVGWDGTKSTWVKTDSEGRLDLAPITVEAIVPVEATVLLTDGFEEIFRWSVAGDGADWIAERRVVAGFQGDYGLYLKTRTTGAAENDVVTASCGLAYYRQRKVEVLLRFLLAGGVIPKYIDFALKVYDSEGTWRAQIRRDASAGVWQYRDSAGLFQTIPGLPTEIGAGSWYMLSFEVDGASHQYGKVRFLGETIDLAPLGFYKELAAAKDRHLDIIITITKPTIPIPELYVDDILIREVA